MVEYEKDYFCGKGYDNYGDYPAHSLRIEHIVNMLNPRSVLDCGCAYGFMVRRFLDRGIYAFGIDISKWAEKQAQKIIPHNFLRHDVREPLPFRDMEFDLLYCEGVLEHIEEQYIDAIMAEFGRVATRRLFQIALAEHENVTKELGHATIKDHRWWFERIPIRTFLALTASTEANFVWLYKG